jgi:hypothetical protein
LKTTTKLCVAIIILLAPLAFCQSDTMLTISEVLFSDKDSLNTFIELYNMGSADINLDSTTIRYCEKSTDALVYKDTLKRIGTSSLILHSHQYAIILNHDYANSDGSVLKNIPAEALRLTMPWNFCQDKGLKSALGKQIYIYKSIVKITLETYTCPNDTPAKGASVEKVSLTKDNSESNWATSRYYRGTPGRMNSVTPKRVDAMLTTLSVQPTVAFTGSSPVIKIGLCNNGTTELHNAVLSLYKITLKDSLIFQNTPNNIPPLDTVFFEFSIPCSDTGAYNFMAKVSAADDEDAWNDTLSLAFHAYKQTRYYGDVIFNELMYAPAGNMQEWVEIYNHCSDTVNLKKWKLCDPSKQSTITSLNTYIAPNSFFIIAKDSLPAKTYPAGTHILTTSFPFMNNDGDYIAIKDSFGLIIDSLTYSPRWGGNKGTSLERMYFDSPGSDSTNWGSSLNPRLCTPGFINSITPKEHDIAITSFSPTAAYYSEADSVALQINITNRGMHTSDSLTVQLYYDTNKDSIATQDEILYATRRAPLVSGQSDSLVVQTSIFPVGKNYFIAGVTAGADNDTSNNYRFASASIIQGGNPRNKIVINEIMYAPPTGEPEWVEIYNRSSQSIDLQKFHIADDADTSAITKNKFILDSGGYCVISRDSSILRKYPCKGQLIVASFPTLNNDGDKVILLDSLYRVIDSLQYSPSWRGQSGTSLERISENAAGKDSLNWVAARTKYRATPGYINSVTPKVTDVAVTSLSTSPAYPVKGDILTPCATITNNGSAAVSNIQVSFSYRNGKGDAMLLMDTVIAAISSKDSLIVKSSHQTIAINDSIIVHAQAEVTADEDTSDNYRDITVKSGTRKGSVVINEIMFNPHASCSEWIELYNTTKDTIGLLGWCLSDVLTSGTQDTIKTSSVVIPPGQYLVAARDTLPVQGIGNAHYILCKYGTLNNSADGIVVKDSRGSVIDSVLYNADWNTRAGKSLERISSSAASNDSLNWLFSYDAHGGTPGRDNSVNSIQSASPGAIAINEIMYGPGGDNAEFIELYNTTADSILLNAWKLTTTGKNNYYITDSIVALPPKTYFVVCSDSVLLVKYPQLQNYNYKCILQSSSLGLLNSNASVVLKDAYKNIIDSVYYKSAWHNPNFTNTNNRSLERINPVISSNDSRNWSSSANKNGATPGETNSIFIGSVSSSSQMTISPNPFSPDNDGHEDFTSISFQAPYPMTQISIKIFDDKGRLMRELTNNETFGSSGTIIYDGRDKNGNPLRLGMYIVLFEAVNPQTGAKQVHKKVLVSARKL